MAHVGKVYKVWFRRDASLDLLNYRDALPECFIARFRTFGGTVGTPLNTLDFLLINTGKDIMPAVWKSERTYASGLFYTCTFSWTNNPNSYFDFADIKVVSGVNTKVFDGKSREALDPHNYKIHHAECGPGTFTLGANVTAPMGGVTLDMRPAPWSIYNP